MFCTGDPDRAPVRCTEPTGLRAHRARGRVRRADRARRAASRSASTCRCRRSCSSRTWRRPASFPKTGHRGAAGAARTSAAPARSGRRSTASCRSGCAAARRGSRASRSLTKLVADDGIPADALIEPATGTTFNQNTATDEDLAAIETAVAEYFAAAHDAGALRHRVRDEPDARAGELAARDLPVGPARGARLLRAGRRRRALPAVVRRRALRRRRGRAGAPGRPARAPSIAADVHGVRLARDRRHAGPPRVGRRCNILEFGSGAAGPIATRYFVEHGATVLRVESKTPPRLPARRTRCRPDNPHGLEGAPMYDGLNVGKRNVTLNLKQPGGGRRSCSGSSSSGPTRSPRTSRRAR